MTIPGLLEILRPYYLVWNEDMSRLSLIAYSRITKISVPVDTMPADGEIPTFRYGDGAWLLGVDAEVLKDRPILELAEVACNSEGTVIGIKPHATASYFNLAPLLKAAREVPDVGEVLE